MRQSKARAKAEVAAKEAGYSEEVIKNMTIERKPERKKMTKGQKDGRRRAAGALKWQKNGECVLGS